MQPKDEITTLEDQFTALVNKGNHADIKKFLDNQNITDILDLIYEFPEQERFIIEQMSMHRAVNVFKLLELTNQKNIIQGLKPSTTAALLNELADDDRTDFLEELPGDVVRELIKLLDPEERRITLSLLGYPENSIGRLMNPDYVYVYAHNTVAEVFQTIRKYGKNSEAINQIYVINEDGTLVDDIRIGTFILSPPDVKVEKLMDRRITTLNPYDDQETASEIFKMNNRFALPVVNDENKLLGIVTMDDIFWVASEEFSEDMQKMGAVQAFEEPYLNISIMRLFKKRFPWLVALFLGEMLTASAMAYFQDEIARAVVLALFIPLIISSGGNSGSQASSLIIQAMAVGELTIKDWWTVMKREFVSGFLLGGVLAIIGFLRIFLYHLLFPNLYGEHWILLGITIALTLVGVVMWGTFSGSMLPLLLKRLGKDPAVSSAPFVATLVDVTGIVIYFSVAYLVLEGTLL